MSERKKLRAPHQSLLVVEMAAVALFFALTMAVSAELLGYAAQEQRKSAARSAEMIAACDLAERLKAEPEAGSYEELIGGVTVRAEVTAEGYGAGTLYTFAVTTDGEAPIAFTTARYLREEAAR